MPNLMLDDKYAKMPWDEIDAVVFDVGGVLVSFKPDEHLNELFPDDPELRRVLKARIYGSPYWHMMDRGLLNLTEAADLMTGFREDLREPINRVMTLWPERLHKAIQENVDFLHECKRRGKKTYVLSNFSPYPFSRVKENHDFFKLFDGIVVSCDIGMVKPCPDIYQHTIDLYGLKPERTLFIDDNMQNIEACLFAGWQGICYNLPGKLDAFWKE